MSPLAWWMLVVSLYHLASIWFRFFNVWYEHHGGPCSKHIFTDTYKWTLANFSLLTCAVCYICAFKLGAIKEKPLYMAIFLTFISVLTYALAELQINRTVDVGKYSPASFLTSTLVVWLFVR